MPGAGIHDHVKCCTCGSGVIDSLTSSSSPFQYSKDATPSKQLFSKDGSSETNVMSSNACSDGASVPFNRCPHLDSFNKKWQSNYWWEAPSGTTSRGRPASCLLTADDPPDSPTYSDLTFEDRTNLDVQRDDAVDAAACNAEMDCKASPSGEQRACGTSTERIPSTASRRGPERRENIVNESDMRQSRDRATRWTDENGRMAIKSNIFDAVLPTVDEVGLQWRISELRVALQASESARLESELETEALRKYVAEVEAAAAGLQSRVHELEHLMTFSTKDGSKELEQLRAKIVTEVSKDARSQSMKAAKAIADAREATMELDKVKRHASSLIKAQEEEAERLRMEAAECRTLYHARAMQLQMMQEQIENLEDNLKTSANVTTDSMKTSKEDLCVLQTNLETAKMEAQEKSKQLAELLEAFEIQAKALESTENRLKEVENERTELRNHSEWLEQQFADLKNQGTALADHDRELRKVRAMLGEEKQHLLMELSNLRHGNESLELELAEWQEKFRNLSQRVSASIGFPAPIKAMDGLSIEDTLECHSKPDIQDNYECSKSATEEKVIDGQECMISVAKDSTRPSTTCSCQRKRTKQNAHTNLNGYCSLNSKISGRKLCGLQEQLIRGNVHHQRSCNLFKDDLLAAAHREIVKLKEINQCLIDARQGKKWCSNSHPEKENIFQK
ncbi:hypothetical protein KP509_34G060000 [Ceratopteris richardii]|uniref:Uncharacterized protein n=1 Tax=Ceratopteris richardii TaxID=49495 RepID=A0A8T2QK88_CERRI|nr:hypothetical protein KP509_34G060000 [Ceratopteris richardii]